MIDNTSLKQYGAEYDAYEGKDERRLVMSELEEKLNTHYIALTDKILYFPGVSSLPDTIELKYHWNIIKKEKKSLSVACKGESYLDIACAVCEGLMGYEYKHNDFWALSNKERKLLYHRITSNPLYPDIKRVDY